jgi:2-desacetyl-2-hydroxyethyl bacteriochlorophyllide A dehydrogenase
MNASTRRAVTFPAPRQVEVVEEPLPTPAPGEVRVQTLMSAVSPGTERLIYRGQVPQSLDADPSIEALSGGLTFPLTYGYAAVGRVEATGEDVDEEWEGRRVFSFQPHVSQFVASPDALVPLPAPVRDEDGVLIPNLETAVTLLMDGRPMIGERVAIFGQGVVGLLTTALASRHPLGHLLTLDPSAGRRSRALDWGADQCLDPKEGRQAIQEALNVTAREAKEAGGDYEGADLVFEVSGAPSALNDALSVTGFDGRVVVGSWYGEKDVGPDLGGRFHRSRMQITSSQVSSIDPSLRGRWTKDRRMNWVVDLLPVLEPGDLVSDVFALKDAPTVYARLDDPDSTLFQPVFRYE